MNKSLIKYAYISYFFLFSIILSADVMLDKDDKLSMPLPLPYDGVVYTSTDLNNFIDSAIESKKQPILIFGANWCPDCRIFSGTMNIPKVNAYIKRHFKVLYIDVKRYEINMRLMEEYGIPSSEGIPRVLVFDKNKKLLNNSNTTEWRTARERSSQEIFNFFQDMTKD